MSNQTMQLTKPSEINGETVIFLNPKADEYDNQILEIRRKYPDNKLRPLVIETPFLFSFGINESKTIPSGKLLGYTLPVCLRGKDEEPTLKQKEFAACLENIEALCHEYLLWTYGVYVSETLKPILYYETTTDKHGRKNRDETVPPFLYPKLIYSGESIMTLFRTKVDRVVDQKAFGKIFKTKVDRVVDKVDSMLYFEKHCTVKLALIIESIFIGQTSASIQVRVMECYVKPQNAYAIKPVLEIEESSSDEETENYDTIR